MNSVLSGFTGPPSMSGRQIVGAAELVPREFLSADQVKQHPFTHKSTSKSQSPTDSKCNLFSYEYDLHETEKNNELERFKNGWNVYREMEFGTVERWRVTDEI